MRVRIAVTVHLHSTDITKIQSAAIVEIKHLCRVDHAVCADGRAESFSCGRHTADRPVLHSQGNSAEQVPFCRLDTDFFRYSDPDIYNCAGMEFPNSPFGDDRTDRIRIDRAVCEDKFGGLIRSHEPVTGIGRLHFIQP